MYTSEPESGEQRFLPFLPFPSLSFPFLPLPEKHFQIPSSTGTAKKLRKVPDTIKMKKPRNWNTKSTTRENLKFKKHTRRIIQNRVTPNQPHVLIEIFYGKVRLVTQPLLDRPEVHRVLDNLKIVRYVQSDGVNGFLEDPSVRMFPEFLIERLA
jgi:hypothetical protein